MSRTPQPLRRMRYLIGEALRQGLISDRTRIDLVRADGWMAGDLPCSPDAFEFVISQTRYPALEWSMEVFETDTEGRSRIISARLLTAPGPETVWIGSDLAPLTIQPRNPRDTEGRAAKLGLP